MSYKTDLQGNNADLQGILDAVNELPEGSSGGGVADGWITVNSGDVLIMELGTGFILSTGGSAPSATYLPYYTDGNVIGFDTWLNDYIAMTLSGDDIILTATATLYALKLHEVL